MDPIEFVEDVLGQDYNPNSRGIVYGHTFGKLEGHISTIFDYDDRTAKATGVIYCDEGPVVFPVETLQLGERGDEEREWHASNSMEEAYGGHDARLFIRWSRPGSEDAA